MMMITKMDTCVTQIAAAGYGPQDQFDWYKVYLNSGEMLQALLYNNGTPSSVWIDMTIYDASSNSLASVSVGDSTYKSVSYLANTSGYYYIELDVVLLQGTGAMIHSTV